MARHSGASTWSGLLLSECRCCSAAPCSQGLDALTAFSSAAAVFFANSAWAQGSIILLTLTLYLYQFHKCACLPCAVSLGSLCCATQGPTA